MIRVKGQTDTFLLTTYCDHWKDAAGHHWNLDSRKGVFSSPQHGSFNMDQWSVIDDNEVRRERT